VWCSVEHEGEIVLEIDAKIVLFLFTLFFLPLEVFSYLLVYPNVSFMSEQRRLIVSFCVVPGVLFCLIVLLFRSLVCHRTARVRSGNSGSIQPQST
jgi:hypothetical protein